MAQLAAMNHSTTNDGLLAGTPTQLANLNSSTSQPVSAKLPLSFWLGSGIGFKSRIWSGRVGSYTACQCVHLWNKREMKLVNG
jgi:hypothetical protein